MQPSGPQSPPFQFGISSLLLITTLVAVVMSVSVMVPGIGIALAVLATPALARTYVLSRRSRADGKPASAGEKVALFMMCLGIATLIALATGAAFFAACFVSFSGASAVSRKCPQPRYGPYDWLHSGGHRRPRRLDCPHGLLVQATTGENRIIPQSSRMA